MGNASDPSVYLDENNRRMFGNFRRMFGNLGKALLQAGDTAKAIEAVKKGHIKRFILVGGCDGAKPGRSYYTEVVEKAPKNTIILTLACGKFRFFDKDRRD